jgi:hypothetical protein
MEVLVVESMELTRRGFVLAGGACMAGFLAACGGAGSFAPSGTGGSATLGSLPGGDPNEVLASLRLEHFDRLVGDSVRMSDGEGTADVTILETVDHCHLNDENPELGIREPFSVVLEGPGDFCSQEGRYDLTHPELGTVTVFVTYMGPHEATSIVGSTVETNRYEIHFN